MRAFFWAVLIGLATQTPRVGESALLYGWAECLAMTGGQQLNEGDQLLILAPGVLTDARTGPIRTPSAGTDCWNRYQEEQPARVSSLPLTKVLGGAPFFAFRREDGFLVVGGAAVRMGPAETERWLREVSSSPAENWRAPTRLVHAYQYTSSGGLAAVELYVGLPRQKRSGDASIDSIVIRRFFVVNGRVLASHEYDRTSGREERVDTEPPLLTVDNWSASETERTVAFLSRDGGRTWDRLSTNVGFEGIWWIAQALRPGLPRTFERYLYTPH